MERRLVLHFPTTLVDHPVISTLVRKFDLDFNILRASVTQEEGNLVIEFKGAPDAVDKAVKYLRHLGVRVQSPERQVDMVRERCTDCTVCVTHCPVAALTVNRTTYSVEFAPEKCIGCGMCVKACPTRAMVLNV